MKKLIMFLLGLSLCLPVFAQAVQVTDSDGNGVGVTSSALDVNVKSSSSDGTTYIDDADWTDDTSEHKLIGGIYESSPQSITDGDTGPLQVDANGKLIESNSASIKTAIEKIDDWDDSDFANVNLNIQGNDVAASAGAVDSATQRTIPASVTGEVITSDGVVNASAGTLYAVYVSFDGVTAGDTIELENDGTDADGTSLCTIVAQASDENVTFTPPVGITYNIGIYYDETLTGGDATVTLVYN